MVFVGNSTGAFFERSLNQLGGLRGQIEKLQTRIGSGVRIERGSDDPVGASRLRALERLERRGVTEAENAARLSQDLAGAANEIGGVLEILQRGRELAISAANDPLGETGRAAIATEIEQMADEIFARSNSRSVTGEPLFAGTAGAPAFVRADDGTISYVGNNQNGTVPVAPGTEIERGLTGSQVFEFEVDGTPSNAFAVLTDLAIALRGASADPAAVARDAITGFDAALDTANRSQTVVGTRLAWVEVIQQDQQNRAVNVAEKRSAVADTDISETIVRLQQTLTALEASQATFTRVASLNLFDAI